MDILAIVKHYKFTHFTDRCITDLIENTLLRTDILLDIIVADGSSLEDAPYEHPTLDVEVVTTSKDLIPSFNEVINLYPTYDLYFCLNNDILFHENWLNSIVTALEDYPEIGIVAPMYDQPGGAWLEMPVDEPFDGGTYKYWNAVSRRLEGEYGVTFHPHVDNCAWGFTKTLIDKIGLPDPRFTGAGWFANQDYCYRARQAGFKVAAVHSSFIHHDHRGTYGKLNSNYANDAYAEGYTALLKKYGGRLPQDWE